MFRLQLDDVALRPLDRPDFPKLYAWWSDPEQNAYAGWARVRTRTAFEAKCEGWIGEPQDDRMAFGIEASGVLVGRIELALIDREQSHAAMGFLIGEKSAWGKGIGSRAIRLMLDYAFTVENLARVHAETFAFNTRSQRVLAKAGFVAEGVRRQHEVHQGRRHDMHLFGILKAEFYQRFDTLLPLPTPEG